MPNERSASGVRVRALLPWVMAAWAMAAVLASNGARAVQIYEQFPGVINAGERYVIYSHNLLGEGDEARPVSAQFGLYDFPAIKQSLFAGGGFNLIAYQRKKNVAFNDHVKQLEGWVRQLLAAGVKPSRITLVGFSRGAQITAYASGLLAKEKINTAIMAICSKGDFDNAPDAPIVLGGNFLSIYETSDQYGSCAGLAKRSHLASFQEVAISTGKSHGAFFEPRSEWIDPLKAWITKTNR
jgi:hypothetical protein